MATTRLRKAFRYLSEDEDEDEAMDDEQQEQLIASLQAEDARKNEFYHRAFLVLPLCALLFVIYTFVFEARTARQRLVALLSASSLACTTYIFHLRPVKPPAASQSTWASRSSPASGPADRHLLSLNAALAGILGLAAMLSWNRGATDRAMQEALPLVVFAMLMFARQQLAPLDLEQLQRARFNLKGA